MRYLKLTATTALLAMLVTACSLGTRRIADIQQFPGKYENRSVSVEGTVTSSWSVPLVPYRFYRVDDGTGEITVLANNARVPTKGAKVRVKGRVEELGTFGSQSVGLHLRQQSVHVNRY